MSKQVLLLLFLFSCNASKQDNVESYHETPDIEFREFLSPVDTLSFQLDDRTNFTTRCLKYVPEVESIFFLNEFENAIYGYSINDYSLDTIIRFEKEGPKGVGKVRFFHFAASDSLWIYSEQFRRVYLSHLDSISFSLDVSSHDNIPIIGWAEPHTTSPMTTLGNHLYLPTLRLDDSTFRNILSINVQTQEFKKVVPHPEVYSESIGGWGPQMQMYYFTTNPGNNQLIFSFPAKHTLMVYTIDGSLLKEVYAGSQYFDAIESPFEPGELNELSPTQVLSEFFTSSSFGPLYYDSFHHRYYRFAFRPNSPERISSSDYFTRADRPASIIILDEDFKILGESDIDLYRMLYGQVFVTSGGLHVGMVDDDENTMNFVRFELRVQ